MIQGRLGLLLELSSTAGLPQPLPLPPPPACYPSGSNSLWCVCGGVWGRQHPPSVPGSCSHRKSTWKFIVSKYWNNESSSPATGPCLCGGPGRGVSRGAPPNAPHTLGSSPPGLRSSLGASVWIIVRNSSGWHSFKELACLSSDVFLYLGQFKHPRSLHEAPSAINVTSSHVRRRVPDRRFIFETLTVEGHRG